jgi:hypothetical protein
MAILAAAPFDTGGVTVTCPSATRLQSMPGMDP